jgi:hypothetical protein
MNSSWRPAPARPASFGRRAAWTAWKRRIGIRARKKPTMKSATASRSPDVARTVAPRNAA